MRHIDSDIADDFLSPFSLGKGDAALALTPASPPLHHSSRFLSVAYTHTTHSILRPGLAITRHTSLVTLLILTSLKLLSNFSPTSLRQLSPTQHTLLVISFFSSPWSRNHTSLVTLLIPTSLSDISLRHVTLFVISFFSSPWSRSHTSLVTLLIPTSLKLLSDISL